MGVGGCVSRETGILQQPHLSPRSETAREKVLDALSGGWKLRLQGVGGSRAARDGSPANQK